MTWRIDHHDGHVTIYGPGQLEIVLHDFDVTVARRGATLPSKLAGTLVERHWRYPLENGIWLEGISVRNTADLLDRLDSRSMLLHLDTPLDQVPTALEALHGQLEENGQRLRISLAGEVVMAEVLQTLAQLNLPIRDIELPRPGLEEVFLDLTGLQLTDRKGSSS